MAVSPADIDLSDGEFWARPLAEREEAFALLRARPAPVRFELPRLSWRPPEPGYYALVRYADIAEASRNPQVFSSRHGVTSLYDLPEEFAEYFGSMINMDDPRHARLRRIVARAFMPRTVQRLADDVRTVAARIVDDLLAAGPGCDFVAEVAARLPLEIICDLMGVPPRHRRTVRECADILLSGGDPDLVADPRRLPDLQLEAGRRLAALAGALADAPGDGLIKDLLGAEVDGERLTRQEVASFFILLAVAGSETTRTAIAHGLRLFTEHPEQRELLLADLDGRLPGAVEEIVRVASPVVWMRRSVLRDYELNGHRLRAGDRVVLYYWSANRDEAVFPDPHRFDITRDPNPHLGFGAPGPHLCLGAHLARREIGVIFRELFTRVPRIRMAGEPERLRASFVNGIKRMRCDF